MKNIDLNGKWRCEGYPYDDMMLIVYNGEYPVWQHKEKGKSFEATVPGCVHTDIYGDKIGDIFYRDNNKNAQWIEKWNWSYKKEFEITDLKKNAKLVFEGLDTYCDVYLNDKHLGFCDDMFIPHVFDIDEYIREGKNEIEVYFRSAPLYVSGHKPRAFAFTGERLFTRRLQCTYGWDWSDRFVTCGIYKPVYIKFDNAPEIEDFYVYTENIDIFSAQIAIKGNVKNFGNGEMMYVKILSPNGKTVWEKKRLCAEKFFKEEADITNVELWYPNGYGAQPLYTLELTFGGKTVKQRFGIRTVKIMRLYDEPDSENYRKCEEFKNNTKVGKETDRSESYFGFTLVVNGIKIMCKGACWVPCEPLPVTVEKEKTDRLLTLLKDAGGNMLRMWGGGMPETDEFYDKCDELGIMLTHDFFIACGEFPEDEAWFGERMRSEIEYTVKRLRNHPSIAWWCGDNEIAANRDPDTVYWGRHYEYSFAAETVERFDPIRSFMPSSPFGGNPNNSKTCGITHNTGNLGYMFDFVEQTDCSEYKEKYKSFIARFIAEEPVMGLSETESLLKFMTKDDIDSDLKSRKGMVLYHSRGNDALPRELMEYSMNAAEKIFGKSASTDEACFKLRYLQYEMIRVSMELARRNKFFSSGILYWMYNDIWPAAISWSIVDHYAMPKAAYYAFKHTAQTIIASVDREDDKLKAYLCNDGNENYETEIRILRLNLENSTVSDCMAEKAISKANETAEISQMPGISDDEILICEAKYEGRKSRAFYKNGGLHLKPAEVTLSAAGDHVTVSAEKYVHAVSLTGGIFEDNYFSLLPGEVRKVKILERTAEEITAEAYKIEV